MSNAVFPDIGALEWPVGKSPIWKNRVRETASGIEYRSTYWTYPRWRWTLNFELLKQYGGATVMDQLFAFFNARAGRFDNFLFEDKNDKTASNVLLGSGNGSQTEFRLARSLGGYTEPVGFANVTQVTLAGSVTGAYTLINGNTLRFSSAVGPSVPVRWTGTYYWRVRFEDDQLEAEQFASLFWRTRSVKLLSEKA